MKNFWAVLTLRKVWSSFIGMHYQLPKFTLSIKNYLLTFYFRIEIIFSVLTMILLIMFVPSMNCNNQETLHELRWVGLDAEGCSLIVSRIWFKCNYSNEIWSEFFSTDATAFLTFLILVSVVGMLLCYLFIRGVNKVRKILESLVSWKLTN